MLPILKGNPTQKHCKEGWFHWLRVKKVKVNPRKGWCIHDRVLVGRISLAVSM